MQIDPTLIDDILAEEAGTVVVPADVRTILLRQIEVEINTVFELLKELRVDDPTSKITAGDVRLILSLRGFNLCM